MNKFQSKTLELIAIYEQDMQEDPSMQQQAEVQPEVAPEGPPQPVTMTTDAEDEYISLIIDAALFEPSTINPEERQSLLKMQEIMMDKTAHGVNNAREDVLPIVLSIINPESTERGLKKMMNNVE